MDKKQSIISAALSILSTRGIHDTPMSAIAKEAQTGMGTIYNYFPNKEILINSIYLFIKEKEAAVFAAFQEDQPIKTQFEAYYTSVIAFAVKNPLFFAFLDQIHASPIITEESRQFGRTTIAGVLKLVEKGKKERIIKGVPTEELMQFIGGTILSYMRYRSQENQTGIPKLDNQLKMVWDAIKE